MKTFNTLVNETRIFHTIYDGYKTLNPRLQAEIMQYKREHPESLPGSNHGCWRGLFKSQHEEQLLHLILSVLNEWSKFYFGDKKMEAVIKYWFNVNDPGSYNMLHHHVMSGAILSGVYYIQAEDTGNLHLGTINQWTRQVKPPLPFHDLVDHKPRDGELLLFPSHLLHDVGPNNSVRHRINMAFNVEFPKEVP